MSETIIISVWLGVWVLLTVVFARIDGQGDAAPYTDPPLWLWPLFFGWFWPAVMALLLVMAPLMLISKVSARKYKKAQTHD